MLTILLSVTIPAICKVLIAYYIYKAAVVKANNSR